MFENSLQSYNTERISGLGVVHDVFVPHFSLVKRSQAQELEKRPDIVQLVLNGSSRKTDSTFSLEVAGSSRDHCGGVLDETRNDGTSISNDYLLHVAATIDSLSLVQDHPEPFDRLQRTDNLIRRLLAKQIHVSVLSFFAIRGTSL
jgi:hypothetical protein